MTQLLQKAFKRAASLSDEEQNAFANWLLEELASEQRWQKAFADSEDSLEKLADEALAEHRAGRTQELDPGKL